MFGRTLEEQQKQKEGSCFEKVEGNRCMHASQICSKHSVQFLCLPRQNRLGRLRKRSRRSAPLHTLFEAHHHPLAPPFEFAMYRAICNVPRNMQCTAQNLSETFQLVVLEKESDRSLVLFSLGMQTCSRARGSHISLKCRHPHACV